MAPRAGVPNASDLKGLNCQTIWRTNRGPLRVKSVILDERQRLPVYPQQRTSAKCGSESVRGQSRPFGARPVNVWIALDRGHWADTPPLLGSARSCHRLTRRRRRLREVPISRNKTSGHTTWLDVERPQLPAGWLRSPALVDLGGYHGRCLWPQRSVRSARALPVFRSPHA
jgi:hypothetical protein